MEFSFESSIRGYHVYKEENNANDKFAVKLVRNDGNKEQCVGHMPIEHSKVYFFS